jgi:hypothetical protein
MMVGVGQDGVDEGGTADANGTGADVRIEFDMKVVRGTGWDVVPEERFGVVVSAREDVVSGVAGTGSMVVAVMP